MANIALIPIDNRPVSYQLPKLIMAQAKEHSLFLPDINFLGDLTKPAKIDKIFSWIESLDNIDYFIISLDTLAYGGLIPSRRTPDCFNKIIKRVNRLKNIVNAKVFAFSSIMRISNNNINEEEKEYWSVWGKKIFKYSHNFHKYGKVQSDIPQEILQDYLNTRKRNFEVNKYYLELKKTGVIDTLVFSKDDCAQFGLNVMEAQELNKLALNSVFIKTGADEIPLSLLSRAINSEKHVKIAPLYTQPDCVDKISNYEDITVKQSVESQIELSGGIVSNITDCDLVLLVNNFRNKQGELVMNIDTPLFNGEIILPNKPFCTADIVNANGADNNFTQKLLTFDLTNFKGYAAWNTTGNTLGSVISSALTYYRSEKPDISAFNELQLIRFLDDWCYQANLRAKIRNDKKNLNPEFLTSQMKKYFEKLKLKFPTEKSLKCHFPWNRFFEIACELQ